MIPLEDVIRLLPFGEEVVETERTPLGARVERLTLTLRDGARRLCLWKRESQRELAVYRSVLRHAPTGAPALLGFDAERGWLLLEALDEDYYDMTSAAEVRQVYCHLGRMHQAARGVDLPELPPGSPWSVTASEVREVLESLPRTAPLAERAAEVLSGGPVSLVHGDYHRWNIALTGGQVRAWDWEHAAISHPVWDLVLLHPEPGPGWDGAPSGVLAEVALEAYHESGPLCTMGRDEFQRLHRLARLFVAARWIRYHEGRAAGAPPGLCEVVLGYAERERVRVEQLAELL